MTQLAVEPAFCLGFKCSKRATRQFGGLDFCEKHDLRGSQFSQVNMCSVCRGTLESEVDHSCPRPRGAHWHERSLPIGKGYVEAVCCDCRASGAVPQKQATQTETSSTDTVLVTTGPQIVGHDRDGEPLFKDTATMKFSHRGEDWTREDKFYPKPPLAGKWKWA